MSSNTTINSLADYLSSAVVPVNSTAVMRCSVENDTCMIHIGIYWFCSIHAFESGFWVYWSRPVSPIRSPAIYSYVDPSNFQVLAISISEAIKTRLLLNMCTDFSNYFDSR